MIWPKTFGGAPPTDANIAGFHNSDSGGSFTLSILSPGNTVD
ncbi:MAG: hypothetical protein WBY44_06700 [Bryobacteraceae bacterium]